MSSVDGEPARLRVPLAVAAAETKPPRDGGEGFGAPVGVAVPVPAAVPADSAVPAHAPLPQGAARDAPVSAKAPGSPAEGGLAALLEKARAAQAQLAHQPLPITNHNSRLIMKLFGG